MKKSILFKIIESILTNGVLQNSELFVPINIPYHVKHIDIEKLIQFSGGKYIEDWKDLENENQVIVCLKIKIGNSINS